MKCRSSQLIGARQFPYYADCADAQIKIFLARDQGQAVNPAQESKLNFELTWILYVQAYHQGPLRYVYTTNPFPGQFC